MGPRPSFRRSDQRSTDTSVPSVLCDHERCEPGNIVFRMDRGEEVGRGHSDDAAIDLGDEGYRSAPLREARQASRHIASVGWISELPEQTAQGGCVTLRGCSDYHGRKNWSDQRPRARRSWKVRPRPSDTTSCFHPLANGTLLPRG